MTNVTHTILRETKPATTETLLPTTAYHPPQTACITNRAVSTYPFRSTKLVETKETCVRPVLPIFQSNIGTTPAPSSATDTPTTSYGASHKVTRERLALFVANTSNGSATTPPVPHVAL